MTISQMITPKPLEAVVKRTALVIRVSTDRQAMNQEGSLKNQLQRLREHIKYKVNTSSENWIESGLYELKGISGKNSMRSHEFERLFADISTGRVNTVLCTALDRICRSVKDFLWFFEFLNEHNAEFVCLKQNYDTTSPQGRLFVTMMMALAQFEREQTAERTRDAVAARSERGLWNGGRLLGYDTDPNKKSALIPNQQEAAIINFAFDTYIECGSITETAEAMNRQGYRSKSFNSRRNIFHPGGEFYVSIVQHLLKNSAYIGKKEINRQNINKNNCPHGKEYRLVDAAWPAIVSSDKFEAVQQIMKENGQTRRNAAEPVKHAYVLSRGILHCGRCGSLMDGRYGTGRLGTKYFYYVCRNKECNLRLSAGKVEQAVLARLKYLAGSDDALHQLTEEANKRLLEQKPALEKQKQELLESMAEIKSQANKLLENLCDVEKSDGIAFVKDKLAELSHSRGNIETEIAEVEESLRQINEKTVETEAVKKALIRINEVYDQLKPFERRDLMGVVLKNAKVNKREIILEIYALNDVVGYENDESDEKVCSLPGWLPDKDSNLEPSG